MKRRAEVRRLEILRAAARAFRQLGYHATGMRDIAAEADLSPGNLYHYFKGKEEILFFCQDRSLDNMLEALERARLSGGAAPDQLRAVADAHVRVILDELEGSDAHLELDVLGQELRDKLIKKRDRYERGIRKLIAEGLKRGELLDCDPVLVTRAMLGALNWTVRWYRPEGPRSIAAVARSLADYVVRGIDPSPAGGAAVPETEGGSS
ncbi:hypothetical protein ABI59_20800 [Acidobacteria bacterium Mor1]|nr:hypothetical protein ABI59_20800 [Acidobacteria bacterium Mor1]